MDSSVPPEYHSRERHRHCHIGALFENVDKLPGFPGIRTGGQINLVPVTQSPTTSCASISRDRELGTVLAPIIL